MTRRFECILDPSERYLVWDNESDLPVLLDGSLLARRNKQDAERIARLLDARDRAGRALRNLALAEVRTAPSGAPLRSNEAGGSATRRIDEP